MKPPALTPLQQRRAAYDKLIASLVVPKHISIGHVKANKARPGSGVFASV